MYPVQRGKTLNPDESVDSHYASLLLRRRLKNEEKHYCCTVVQLITVWSSMECSSSSSQLDSKMIMLHTPTTKDSHRMTGNEGSTTVFILNPSKFHRRSNMLLLCEFKYSIHSDGDGFCPWMYLKDDDCNDDANNATTDADVGAGEKGAWFCRMPWTALLHASQPAPSHLQLVAGIFPGTVARCSQLQTFLFCFLGITCTEMALTTVSTVVNMALGWRFNDLCWI